jgi:hypothetical protein
MTHIYFIFLLDEIFLDQRLELSMVSRMLYSPGLINPNSRKHRNLRGCIDRTVSKT